jgi:phosphoribosylaminoimidazole-succinocarboxamide synthase
MGKPGQKVPHMSDEWIKTISGRYIELYELVTGEKFKPMLLKDEETNERIIRALDKLQ